MALTLPSLYWPIEKLPPLKFQGHLGSCVAHGVRFSIVAADMAIGINVPIEPSRLHIYYHGRELMNTIDSDSGLTIRDGIKAAVKFGYCPEDLWPYSDDGATFKRKPPSSVEDIAKVNRVIKYQAVQQDATQLKSAIVAEGLDTPKPVVFGFTCYQSIFQAPNGDIQNPGIFDSMVGGHAICLCGFDDAKQRFLVANWWEGWGTQGGYGTMSYSYVLSRLASDFWRIISVPVDEAPPAPPQPTPPAPSRFPVIISVDANGNVNVVGM